MVMVYRVRSDNLPLNIDDLATTRVTHNPVSHPTVNRKNGLGLARSGRIHRQGDSPWVSSSLRIPLPTTETDKITALRFTEIRYAAIILDSTVRQPWDK